MRKSAMGALWLTSRFWWLLEIVWNIGGIPVFLILNKLLNISGDLTLKLLLRHFKIEFANQITRSV